MRRVQVKKAPARPGKAIQAKWPMRHEELTRLIEEGPQAAGYTGGTWTAPGSPPAVRGSLSQERVEVDREGRL